MSIYNKEFQYGGHRFNIKVELDHLVERHMHGKREHLVVVNDMGPHNYYKKSLCETRDLVEKISVMEKEAKEWVNSLSVNDSQEGNILEGLGFIKS